jgi:hypothetical protein
MGDAPNITPTKRIVVEAKQNASWRLTYFWFVVGAAMVAGFFVGKLFYVPEVMVTEYGTVWKDKEILATCEVVNNTVSCTHSDAFCKSMPGACEQHKKMYGHK